MRSWLKDIKLQDLGRLTGYNYDIGVAAEGAFAGDIKTSEMVCRFNGILQTISFIENTKHFGNRKPNKNDSSFERRDSEDWTQYPTYDESVEQMRRHPESFRQFTESDMRLHDQESVGNMVEFDTQGDYIDIGKVMTGEPESFGVMCGGKIENRFCSIVVNGNARCDVSKKAISRKASRILRLIDMLELNGVRCELGLTFTTHQVHCEIVVKQYNDPLDINDIAIGLSPDFFRWVVFRLTEHSKLKGDGYGQPIRSDLSDWQDEDADNTILVNALDYDASTSDIDDAFDGVEKRIKDDNFASGKNYVVKF